MILMRSDHKPIPVRDEIKTEARLRTSSEHGSFISLETLLGMFSQPELGSEDRGTASC